MAQGGGSATVVAVGGMLLFLLCLLQCVEGATYVVGDSQGWNLATARSWPVGKIFRAGDTLVFNYNTTLHDVVVVTAQAYRDCTTRGARPLISGSDKVTLRKGVNHFICSKPGHCAAGMKIAVTAT